MKDLEDGPVSPALPPGWEVQLFDGGGRERSYLLSSADGGRWHVNGRIVELLQALGEGGTLEEGGFERAAERLSEAWRIEVTPEALERYVLERFPGSAARPSRLSSLTFRVTLIPERWLAPLAALAAPLFARRLFAPLLAATVALTVGWAVGAVRGPALLAAMTSPAAVGLFVVSTFLHEVGHAAACRRQGCGHGALGFGLYLAFPVLYMEVDESWGLSRWGRAKVDLGGIHLQLLFGLVLVAGTSGGSLAPAAEGAMVLIAFGVLGSLNPVLRFDGYWLATDLLGVPNLRVKMLDALRALAGRRRMPLIVPGGLPAARRAAFLTFAVVGTLLLAFMVGMLLVAFPSFARAYPARAAAGVTTLISAVAGLEPLTALGALVDLALPTAVVVGLPLVFFNLVRPRRRRTADLL